MTFAKICPVIRFATRPSGASIGGARPSRIHLATALLLLAFACLPARGQGPDATPAPPVPEPEVITAEALDERLKSVSEDTALDDEAKAKVREVYQTARKELEAIQAAEKGVAQWDSMSEAAVEQAENAKQAKAEGTQQLEPLPPDTTPVPELDQQLSKIEATLKETTEKLTQLNAEPKRRAGRLAEIPERIAEATPV